MVSPQVILLTFVQLRPHTCCVALIIIVQVCRRGIVLLQLGESLRPSISVLKVVCFYVIDKVFVDFLVTICF